MKTICPVCKCDTDKIALTKLAKTFEVINGDLTFQYWHRSCLIGQSNDDLVSEENSLCHEVLDSQGILREFLAKRERNRIMDYEYLKDKYQDLKDTANEVLDGVIKWL